MRLILMFEDNFPTSGYIDAIGFLEPIGKNASIDLLSLGKLRTLLDTLRKALHFFHTVKEGIYPNLQHLASGVTAPADVMQRIDTILDRHGEIKDTASDELYSIRRSLRDKEINISKRMNAILRQAQQEGLADADASVSIRDGKMLIPVASAKKRAFQGFVYDESATGKTTFMEPAEVVALQNEIAELHFAETREIARILYEFAEFLRPYVPELLAGATLLGELDFIMAKAHVALDYIAGMPVLSEDGTLRLRKARHPLLEKSLRREKKEMVPLTVTLTPEKRILLISGPNAGGKSVCLKTVGLLQYMFQWGMPIPTSETSELPVFDRIMVSIGDDQSLENDLSTYSSFLTDMKAMLAVADSRTLILIDEFGSGTEPAAGGAIAEAILHELDSRGAYGVITTHYTNLKLYASTAETGVVNGAMQFDAATVTPLFQLEQGLPGSSFAFELARKMGMPEAIVHDAEQRAVEQFVGIERNLRKIAKSRRQLDEKLTKIRATDKTLEGLTDRYERELETWIMALGTFDTSQMYYKRFVNAREETAQRISEVRSLWTSVKIKRRFWQYAFYAVSAVWALLVLIFGISNHQWLLTHWFVGICLTVGTMTGIIVGTRSYFKGFGPFMAFLFGILGFASSLIPVYVLKFVEGSMPSLFNVAVVLLSAIYVVISIMTDFSRETKTDSGLINEVLNSDDVKSSLLEPLYYTFKTRSYRYKSSKFGLLNQVTDQVRSVSGEAVVHYVLWTLLVGLLVAEFCMFSPKLLNMPNPDLGEAISAEQVEEQIQESNE